MVRAVGEPHQASASDEAIQLGSRSARSDSESTGGHKLSFVVEPAQSGLSSRAKQRQRLKDRVDGIDSRVDAGHLPREGGGRVAADTFRAGVRAGGA
jgi:hypothetical protein